MNWVIMLETVYCTWKLLRLKRTFFHSVFIILDNIQLILPLWIGIISYQFDLQIFSIAHNIICHRSFPTLPHTQLAEFSLICEHSVYDLIEISNRCMIYQAHRIVVYVSIPHSFPTHLNISLILSFRIAVDFLTTLAYNNIQIPYYNFYYHSHNNHRKHT